MQSLIICHAVNLERPKPSQHYYELTTTVVNNCVLIVHTYIHTFIDHFPKGAFQCQLQRKG